MRQGWIEALQAATAGLWLVIGLTGLAKGDHGFIPIAATASGLLGSAAIWLNRRAPPL